MTATTNVQRPGLKLGSRTEFLVIGDVVPGDEDVLRQILREHMANPRTQQAIEQIGTLHEARFVLLDGGKRLMFCSTFDGTWDEYIDDFAATDIGQNLDETFGHVQGYRASSPHHQGLVRGARGASGQLCLCLYRADGEGGLKGAGPAEGVPAGAGHPRRRRGAAAPGAEAAARPGRRLNRPADPRGRCRRRAGPPDSAVNDH